MRHRHLDTTEWTLAAIDSAIEYGDLADWRQLFAAVRREKPLAERVLHVARAHPVRGAELARRLALDLWPELASELQNSGTSALRILSP